MGGMIMAGLNMNKINDRLVRKVNLEEALSKIEPISWPEEVLSGKKRVEITNAEKEDKACVKLEISLL